MRLKLKTVMLILVLSLQLKAQVKLTVNLIGGDQVPQLKKQIQITLETIFLEMNRINTGKGSLEALQPLFSVSAFKTFNDFVIKTNFAGNAMKNILLPFLLLSTE